MMPSVRIRSAQVRTAAASAVEASTQQIQSRTQVR
jgi:hypothetical protein